MDWANFFTSLGGSAVATAIISFIFTKFFEARLESRAKTFEHELNIALNRFSTLHQKRADIIAELFRKIVELEKMLGWQGEIRKLTQKLDGFEEHVVELRKQQVDDALKLCIEINDYIRINKIYFSDKLTGILEDLQNASNKAIVLMGPRPMPPNIGNIEERVSAAAKDYYTARMAIEAEFKQLLGV